LGIPLGGGGGRRSYADYGRRNRAPRPQNDPFRIAFYLAVIIGLGWLYFNYNDSESLDFLPQINLPGEDSGGNESQIVGPRPTATPAVNASDLANQAQDAYNAGRLEEAIDLYEQAARLDAVEPEYPYQAARLLVYLAAMQYGDTRDASLERAYEHAQMTILADPNSAKVYAIEGKVLDWQGQPEDALNSISEAIAIDDTFAPAYGYLAEAQIDLQRYEQATDTVELGLSIDPQNVDLRRDYGYVLEVLGDYQSAATQYETALRLQPNLNSIKYFLALNYFVSGRYQDSLDVLFELASIYPQNALIPYQIGVVYETGIGDPTQALTYYEDAAELDESYARPWERIGAIEFTRGNWQLVTAPLERALSLGRDTTAMRYQLGLAYAYRGECTAAIEHLVVARDQAEGDEFILDVVNSGFEACENPTDITAGEDIPEQETGNDDNTLPNPNDLPGT